VLILLGDAVHQFFEDVFPICRREDQLASTHDNLDLRPFQEAEFFRKRLREANG
jgi:hypothetical protein